LEGGFALDGYWVWGGSAVRGEDGRYHLFASRWPRELAFHPHWLTHSEIVRAVADSPLGPYRFAEVVLPARGEGYWDGRMTHNPTVHRFGGRYLLFYTGTTYAGAVAAPLASDSPQAIEALGNQRVGLATAPSVTGPWTRRDAPIIDVRPGQWDAFLTTNPAALVQKGRGILLLYKGRAVRGGRMRIGLAWAPHAETTFTRMTNDPLALFDRYEIEDPYWWEAGGRYLLIAKDQNGTATGTRGAGVCAWSSDALDWRLCEPPTAYPRAVSWSDGTTRPQHRLERPQLLIEDGAARYLFLAAADGPGLERGGHDDVTRARNVAVPLVRSDRTCDGR
jgi:hypothetical protein